MESQEGRGVGERESGKGEVVRQEKWVERVQIIVCSSEWNQCMLNSVNKFKNAVLVTNWKITLIFFWFPFQGAVFGQSEETTGGVGWIGILFIYLFIFVNRFFCLFVQFFTIIIIKCKASFSCHSSLSHYSTQGFILLSFHFIFFFFKK